MVACVADPREGYCAHSGDALATLRHEAFVGHFGMEASRNNRGQAHENGAVDSRNRHLKTVLAQALILRSSRDFASIRSR